MAGDRQGLRHRMAVGSDKSTQRKPRQMAMQCCCACMQGGGNHAEKSTAKKNANNTTEHHKETGQKRACG